MNDKAGTATSEEDDSGKGKRRERLGILILLGSFVPFLLSLGLAAFFTTHDDHTTWPVVGLYAVSIAMWYIGLAVGGSALVARMRDRRRARKAGKAADAADAGTPST